MEVVRDKAVQGQGCGMTKLADISADQLREELAAATDPKAVKRLMIALSYKNGESVDELSDRFGIPASTVYYWLDRFEERPVGEAIADESRPGRPAKLDETQRQDLVSDLNQPPGEFDYESADWTPELVRIHLEDTYDVIYSLGHVRRLLRDLDNAEANHR